VHWNTKPRSVASRRKGLVGIPGPKPELTAPG
jgi:hypothetical protein